MKKRSKIVIPPKILIFVLTLVCISLMILSVAKPAAIKPVKSFTATIIVPFETGINKIGRWFTSIADNFANIDDLRKENDKLKKENAELRDENNLMAQDRYELSRLRDLYELDNEYTQYPKIAARVIGKDTSNWFNVFTINKGSEDGIAIDMNVISGGGLVGIVTDVGKNYAKVRAVIDDESSVSVCFANTSDTAIVSGDLKLIDEGMLNITGISKDATVTEGDMVVTSQISDKFLPGILVGYVRKVSLDSNKLSQSGTITPVVDYLHIDEVLVITEVKEKPED